jgi:tRNA(Ile)-lysidine synthase
MENSRNSRPADLPEIMLATLRGRVFHGANVVVGLSGGMDSVVLLHLACSVAPQLRFSLRAIHVNHGLSPNAAQWAAFCEQFCASLKIPLSIENVDPGRYRTLGREGAARAARWAAFESQSWDFLLLAHHQDDQAETVLLRLLRGSGTVGLSAMSPISDRVRGQVMRPFLGVGREHLRGYARANALAWIEDESNDNQSLDRNFLRHRILPEMATRFPHAGNTLARSAGLLEEAGELLDELARVDLAHAQGEDSLDLVALKSLGSARARNAFRGYLRSRGMPLPGHARMLEIWKQLCEARKDGAMCVRWDGCVVRRYRNRIYVDIESANPSARFESLSWTGEPNLPVLELGGVLVFRPEEGKGLSLEKLKSAPVTVRLRHGGEQLCVAPNRPRRSLKNLWQEHGVPPWQRERRPLLYCGETLVSVPGLGDQWEWNAAPGERGVIVSWQLINRQANVEQAGSAPS